MTNTSFNRIKIRQRKRIKYRKQTDAEVRELENKRKILQRCGCPECQEVLDISRTVQGWIRDADKRIKLAREGGR